MLIAAEVLGRDSNIFLQKSEALSMRILKVLKTNLADATQSVIAKEWARNLNTTIEYSFDLLNAFQKGLTKDLKKLVD